MLLASSPLLRWHFVLLRLSSICCFATRKSNEASLCSHKRASADCSTAARFVNERSAKHQGECLAPKWSIIRRRSTKCHFCCCELARSIYFFFGRYVASQLDIFLASLEIRYMLTSFAFDMLPHGKRESIAPHLLLLHSRCPLATHIERVSAISSFVYLVCDEVCKTYRAARQRRISTLGRAERNTATLSLPPKSWSISHVIPSASAISRKSCA